MDEPVRLLLVEDNPGDARLIRHHLRSPVTAEFVGETTVDHAESLTEGLETFDPARHDVVLLDLGLPESTGVETLDRFTGTAPAVPIIVLTGNTENRVAIEAFEHGAHDYLTKERVEDYTLARSLRYSIERFEHERELVRQNERLEEFARLVSHDLRNPLNTAKAYLDAVRSDCDHDDLETIETAHDRMATIIEDVLSLARNGAAVRDVQSVSLWVAARAAESVTPLDGRELLVADDLPSLEADPERLSALLENLFRNSVEHGSRSDGAESKDRRTGQIIRVGALEGGFYVEDDGRGIPVGERESVFEPGHTTSSEGTGFGLAIVKRIADAHGWTVSVAESDEGGARFELWTGGGINRSVDLPAESSDVA